MYVFSCREPEVSQWAEALAITEGRSQSCPSISPFQRPCLAGSGLANSVLAGPRLAELGLPDSDMSRPGVAESILADSRVTGPTPADSRLTGSELCNARLSHAGSSFAAPALASSSLPGSELPRFAASNIAGSDQTSSRLGSSHPCRSPASGSRLSDPRLSRAVEHRFSSSSMACSTEGNASLRDTLMQDMQQSSRPFPGIAQALVHSCPALPCPALPRSVPKAKSCSHTIVLTQHWQETLAQTDNVSFT